MRPRQLRRLYALMAFGAIIAGSVIGTGIAKATPDGCGSLTVSPTVGTVEQLVWGFVADGYAARAAGEIIAATVFAACPQFVPVLHRFVNTYAGGSTERA